ncbi:HD domain-containing protein [Frateuria hangzhouensis]|uniref:HD domain-containing protein n=1 Tax=Frateuria hangzhouensis TaxID=2995589 RepID=UPI002260992C|nr:N-methyl-D-aspartate receptor NMDAR2C subunit [Frateuria sp. STR12]MCX7515145.1 N-methyl-D-aspartate receptor NMDAR2C subunit [Frateuria sp. STR12]
MAAWGLPTGLETWRELVAAYGQSQRHYHTGAHVDACLRHLDACAGKLDSPREVELALWFHDAVYDPRSLRNERRSADWARDFLVRHGASPEAVERVVGLVMATCHEAPARTKDESFLVDIDLSILAADPVAYERFEQAIRKEYRHVPWPLYRTGRARLLRQFLARPRIYRNEPFVQWEGRARDNLARAVERLETGE